ncbi:LamG-like jellyroll fold domain-containing protein [Ruania alba]|nr:LamG-like jellyroll fold domain-containing protein [Ruania alba]
MSLLHGLTGEDRYAERGIAELEAVANFPDWSDTFLSTAELAHACAMGYDWLYHRLSHDQRDLIRGAIVELGLKQGLVEYRDSDRHGNSPPWSTVTGNWNFVGNAGMAAGALAIGDEEPEVAEEVLRSSLDSVAIAAAEFAPDGAWPEGMGYWGYTMRYWVSYLRAFESAVGTSFGLSDSPGFSETGYFPIYMTSPLGMNFNYYDTDLVGRPYIPEMFWMASRYEKPSFSWWGNLDQSVSPERKLLYFDPEVEDKNPIEQDLPFDKLFRTSEAVTLRAAWEQPLTTFAGFKGGFNDTSHADLDLGTFVFDALGHRWASDLGKDDYSLPGYNNRRDGSRWTYYRKRAEGNNTLVVNPGAGPEQDPMAKADIVEHGFGPLSAFAIADLTAAYANRGVTSWRRGVSLRDHRRQLVVRDELQASEPAEVWWFMHTEAEVDVAADGLSAVLSVGDDRVAVQIVEPAEGVRFSVRPATPLPSSPDPEGQNPNTGVQKLTIEASGVTDLQLAVVFTPLRHWEEVPAGTDLDEIEPLAQWAIPASKREVPMLADLTIDGEPLTGFVPEVFTYDLRGIVADAVGQPVLEARADDARTRVNVRQASSVPGTSRIDLIAPGSPRVRYEVHLDWTVLQPFADAWDFRDQDPAQSVAGSDNGTLAVLGQSTDEEPGEPAWVSADLPGGEATVLSLEPRGLPVSVPETADVDLSAGFAFEAMIFQHRRTTLPRIMAKGEGAQLWIYDDGSLRVRAHSATGARYGCTSNPGMLPLETWVNVRLTYSAGESGDREFRIFVDGQEVSYQSQGDAVPAHVLLGGTGSPLLIGNAESTVRGLDGLLAQASLAVPGTP